MRDRRTLKWTGMAAGAAAFVLLSGCRSDQSKEAAAVPQEASAAPMATAQAERPNSPGITLIGPRSQADVEECFAVPKNIAFNPVKLPEDTPRAAAPAGPVVAGAGWDVKLTRAWKHIVIHHSASPSGSAASFDRAHKARGWDGLGYHFVIGNGEGSGDGQVEVGYRWMQQERGAHAGNMEYNEHGIGICLVGNFEFERPSARQMESLRALVRFLQSKTGIAAAEIIGHQHVPGKDTQCPGRLFNMAGFRTSLAGGSVAAAEPVKVASATPAKQSATPAKASAAKNTKGTLGAGVP